MTNYKTIGQEISLFATIGMSVCKLAERTRQEYLKDLADLTARAFFNFLHRHSVVAKNVASDLSAPQLPKCKPRFLFKGEEAHVEEFRTRVNLVPTLL